ncbi:MAG: hypothetical protein ACRD5R_11935 [Candidatus Acidiferrales bacterium]
MDNNACRKFSEQIASWVEGQRTREADAHLRECTHCRNLLADLGLIEAAARDWASEEFDPPAQVWTSLRARLQREGLLRAPQKTRRNWLGGWLPAIPRPVLAGAYLAALVAIAFGLSGPVHSRINQQRWLETAQNTAAPLDAELNGYEQATISSIPKSDPVITASLHKNLAIVDNYITLCEKSVDEEPQNETARDFLYDAYQQKADLLAQMSERGEYGQ